MAEEDWRGTLHDGAAYERGNAGTFHGQVDHSTTRECASQLRVPEGEEEDRGYSDNPVEAEPSVQDSIRVLQGAARYIGRAFPCLGRVAKVPGLGHYWVTDSGLVFSTARGRFRRIRYWVHIYGHKHVDLYKDAVKVWRPGIHQLVLLAFIGDYPEGMTHVMHINDNAGDNRLVNLRYGTERENSLQREAKKARVKLEMQRLRDEGPVPAGYDSWAHWFGEEG